jgi:DNA-binding NarL/FixJ family response regulator
MSIRVAIVDDDRFVREGIAMLIAGQEDLECVGVFENAETFMQELKIIKPQVVLMDIELPGHSGITCIRHVKITNPDVQFMMFTVYDNPEKIFDALSAGATGYILKNTTTEKLVEAIKELYKGGSPMSAQIARLVINSFAQSDKDKEALNMLTIREKEVIHQLSLGLQYKEIAAKLFISRDTVRTYIRNIYEKLHVHTRTDAINKIKRGGR